MEFCFSLKYQLSPVDHDPHDLIERFITQGCSDAQCRNVQPGRMLLSFRRCADAADVAMQSALSDVRRVSPDIRLIEASPDLVGLAEVADLVSVSRQNLRKLMLTHATSFPAPMHQGRAASVWHLCHVLDWLRGRGKYSMAPGTVELARVAMEVNLAKECRHVDMLRREVLRALVA